MVFSSVQYIKKVLDRPRAHLGLGESPPGSNSNFIVDWYNEVVSRIGNGSWCEMTVTWELWTGGAKILKRGRAYCPWGAQDAANGVNGSSWHWGTSGMRAGDQVYYNWSARKGSVNYCEHTGIVEYIHGNGTFDVLEGNTDDRLLRRTRDGHYVVGYVRFAWDRLADNSTEDNPMAGLEYVSLGMSNPQAVKKGRETDAVFDLEYGDVGDAHAGDGKGTSKDAFPGILVGVDKKTSFWGNVEVPDGIKWYLVETDPKDNYKVTKTYPSRTGPWYESGKVESNQHLYVRFKDPGSDTTINVAIKFHYVEQK